MPSDNNNERVMFPLRIEPELKAKAEKRAKGEVRSLNGYIVNLIKRDVKKETRK